MSQSERNRALLKKMTVLYVEDDSETRRQLEQILRRHVGTLWLAENGESGLQAFHDHRPDIVVTDILMPVKGGLAMAQEIRSIDKQISIIVITAFDQADYLRQAIDIGIDKFVTKPVNMELLFQVLEECALRLHNEQQLRLAAKVYENSPEGILISDSDNNIISINHAFTASTGYSEAEVMGRNPRMLSSGRHDRAFYESMWHGIITSGGWHGEVWNKRKSGEVYPEWLSVATLTDASGKITHHIGLFSDISERKAAEEMIQHLAQHDSLTGLPNRNLLQDRLTLALASARRNSEKLALMFVDLDNFKAVNDSFGHHVGDLLLQEIARRLLSLFRASDTVCRLGGDEFLILINEVADRQDAIAAAEKVLAAIPPDLVVEGHAMGVTPSIGIALYPDHGGDMETLIRHADAAMYASKRAGRSGFMIFSDDQPPPTQNKR